MIEDAHTAERDRWVEMVLGGKVNKEIVNNINQHGGRAGQRRWRRAGDPAPVGVLTAIPIRGRSIERPIPSNNPAANKASSMRVLLSGYLRANAIKRRMIVI